MFADKFFLRSLENIKGMFLSVPAAVGGWWIHMVVQLHEKILDVLIRPGALQLNMRGDCHVCEHCAGLGQGKDGLIVMSSFIMCAVFHCCLAWFFFQ